MDLTSHSCRTVLLVDDDARLLRGLERHLSTEAYQVMTAVSAAEATAVLNHYPVDVIVCDNHMPGMTGTEFLRQVRDRFPKIVTIMLSGNISVPVALEAINEIGVYRMFSKPCRAVELALAIRQAFEVREQLDNSTVV